MMIKVGSDYLDFEGDIEVDRQANLFEDISKVNGDFSYSFDLPDTQGNREKLGILTINSVPTFTQKTDCVIYSSTGEDLFYGYLRVERITDVISCSFFSGNNNWFVLTDSPLREYNFTIFDKEFTEANVLASHVLSNGIVWPLMDRGTLNERGTETLYDNDWQPFVYIKDVIKTVLNQEGIKLEGDIIKDPVYNSMITSNNGITGVQNKIDQVKLYANKTITQSITSTTYTNTFFQDTTTSPYYEGTDNNWDGTTYTVTRGIIEATLSFNLSLANDDSGLANTYIRVRKNSTTLYEKVVAYADTYQFLKDLTITDLYAGDTIVIQTKQGNALNNFRIYQGTIKFDPLKLRNVTVNQLVPDVNASEYISSIFSRFNLFVSYNSKNKTIHTKSAYPLSLYYYRIACV